MPQLAYCDKCERMQPLGIADRKRPQDEHHKKDEDKGKMRGDLICIECFSVITSLSVDEPHA